MRAQLNARDEADYKLSVNDFVIKATALALRKVPGCNASWGGDKIFQYKDIDVSVAVAIEGGLITPIIRNADQKGLSTISNEMKDLASAREGGQAQARGVPGRRLLDLEPRHVRHQGLPGGHQPAAGLHPGGRRGRAAAGGQGRRARPATVMTCTLSIDHRVVDGALGAQFLARSSSS